MATPPRLVHLECPCGTRHWVIDCDHSDYRYPAAPYDERMYSCPGCRRERSGHMVLEKSPPEFFLQPHSMTPMSADDFDGWVDVIRTHFPDHPILDEVGRSFFPYTGPASDPELTEEDFTTVSRYLSDFESRLPEGHPFLDQISIARANLQNKAEEMRGEGVPTDARGSEDPRTPPRTKKQ